MGGDLAEAPGEDLRVGGQRVALEADRERGRLGARARRQPAAEPGEVGEPGHPRGQLAGRRLHVQPPHRRREDRAAEVRRARAGCAARCSRPSNARRDSAAPAGPSSATSVEQRRDVALVVAEVLDVAEHRVGRMPVAEPLAAPVDHRDRRSRAPPAAAATRPYFSANSVRPGKTTAVPRRPPVQATARSRTPSDGRQPEGPRPLRRVGDVRVEGGRRHASRLASFIASPMSPSTASRPLMKARGRVERRRRACRRKVSALGGQRAVGLAVAGAGAGPVDQHRALVLDHDLDRAVDPVAAEALVQGLDGGGDGFAHAQFPRIAGRAALDFLRRHR